MLVFCVDSSDDSYVSAEEDPMEAPVFEFPLQDTTVSAGVDIVLKCIIAGTPNPEGKFVLRLDKETQAISTQTAPFVSFVIVTWMKDNAEVTALTNYTIKVEGERHSLLIKSTRPSDGGKYCVTAVNQVGRASSSAILTVKSGKFDCPPSFILPDTKNDIAQFKLKSL